jgi:cytochrome P450
VSSSKIVIITSSPEAIRQITSRREAFPKPLESYRILDLFGRSILSTEGAEWKQHRKISSPVFNEKNNVLVFAEAISQTQGMLRHWTTGVNAGKTIRSVPQDAMRTTLHIISRIGFGVKLLWPGEDMKEEDVSRGAVYGSNSPPEGHSMTFASSLEVLLEHILLVLLVPKWILSKWFAILLYQLD